MMATIFRRTVVGTLLLAASACDALDVRDPTAIEDSDLANATGADLLRIDAIATLYNAIASGAQASGYLSDEMSGVYFSEALDRRDELGMLSNGDGDAVYSTWQSARREASTAIPSILAYAPEAARLPHAGELIAVRGYATLGLAEQVCPGFPLHEIVNLKPIYGVALTTAQVFERALVDFDSAIAYAGDSTRILDFARIGRARALLGLGRFTEAAATAADVETGYVVNGEYNDTQRNSIGFFGEAANTQYGYLTVTDHKGTNGLDFVTANDPRLPTTYYTSTGMITEIYVANKYPTRSAPMVLASGIEARLIEAEASLDANPAGGDWLAMLNALRTDGTQTSGVYNPGTGGVAGLAPLANPGTQTAREDLLFRERAFWLFGTGHRLGDLRRLLQHYNRSSESVFPTGSFPRGGVFGTATSVPFPPAVEAQYSPSVTGCISL